MITLFEPKPTYNCRAQSFSRATSFTDGFGTVTGKWGTILEALLLLKAIHARQVKQHGEARASLHEGADRRASKAKDEVPFPMTGNSAVSNFGRTLANHDGVPDEGLVAASSPFARHTQGSA